MAVQQGQTAPKAAEALQMLHDLNNTCAQKQTAAFKAALDWVPMILGDGWAVVPLQEGKWQSA
eukprot:4945301-Karenia_brevis.AAC.1